MVVPVSIKKAVRWAFLNRERLFLLLGMGLVGGLSFEAGMLRSSLSDSVTAVISVPLQASVAEAAPVSERPAVQVSSPGKCAFVGSRNSDKYHLPKCAAAKRIKPENLVCFASKEEAEKKGYVAGCLK